MRNRLHLAISSFAVMVFVSTPAFGYVLLNPPRRWFNADTTAHQIASVGGFFESTEPTGPGERYSFLFQDAGTYRYYCALPGHKEQGVINIVR